MDGREDREVLHAVPVEVPDPEVRRPRCRDRRGPEEAPVVLVHDPGRVRAEGDDVRLRVPVHVHEGRLGGPRCGDRERRGRGHPDRRLEEEVEGPRPVVHGDDVRESVAVQVAHRDGADPRGGEGAVVHRPRRERRDGSGRRGEEERERKEDDGGNQDEAGSPGHGRLPATPVAGRPPPMGPRSYNVGGTVLESNHAATPPVPPRRTTSSAHFAAASKCPSFVSTYPLFTHAPLYPASIWSARS